MKAVIFKKTVYLPAFLLSVFVSGCSSIDSTKKDQQPTKLIQLDNSKTIINKQFDSGQLSYYQIKSFKIRPEFDGDNVFSATPNGYISAQTLDGKQLWFVDSEYKITGGLSYDINTQTLIFSTKKGLVVALDGKSGELKWQRQLSGSILAPAAISYNLNRVVLSSNSGTLYGLYLKNGLPVWSYKTPTPKISIRGTAIPVLHKDIAVFATADGRVNVLDAASGTPIWFKQVSNITNTHQVEYLKDVDASPIFDGENMYTVSYGGKLLALNLKDKTLVFEHNVASSKQLLVVNDVLIVVSNTSEVHAYNKITGELIWKNDELMYRNLTNPVYMSSHVTVGDKQGYIHLLDLNTGRIVSREKADGQLDYFEVIGYKLVTQTKNNKVSIWQ